MHRRRRDLPADPPPPQQGPRARRRVGLTLRRAIALGLLQGPTELLPVSSSGHMVLLGSRDRSFDVFLHAGTAAALLITRERNGLRPHMEHGPKGDGALFFHAALMLAPAAVAGLALEGSVERRLGPRAVAVGQIAGGLGLLIADRAPERRGRGDTGARDALLIGLAQACALVPGVSRNGATLTAARLLGFRRPDASRMSRDAALPVILGATALKLARRRDAPPSPLHAAGFAAAFASSLAAARLIPLIDRLPSYAPFGVYRVALGLVAARSA